MALASLLAAGLGSQPAEITVNGRPLSRVIGDVVQALAEQQSAFEQLRDYTYQTNQQQWDRIAALESATARIEADLGIQQRDVTAGQTTQGAIQQLESRVRQLDAKRKGNAHAAAWDVAKQARTSNAFALWRRFASRRVAAKELLRRNVSLNARVAFTRFREFVLRRQRARALHRKAVSLLRWTQRGAARSAFRSWMAFADVCREVRVQRADAQHAIVSKMSSVSARAHVRQRFLDWRDAVLVRRARDAQREAAASMERASLLALARRAFGRWQVVEEVTRRRRIQVRAASSLLAGSMCAHGAMRFEAWKRWLLRRQVRRRGARLVATLHTTTCLALAGRAYAKLHRFAEHRRRHRDMEGLEDMVLEVNGRCDTLSSQLDVAVKALGTTNQALAKLAQRMGTVESRAAL